MSLENETAGGGGRSEDACSRGCLSDIQIVRITRLEKISNGKPTLAATCNGKSC